MRLLISVLVFLNGSYMLLDKIFVILKGKYIGPQRPGPWAELFYKLKVDVFKPGPLFIIFGLVWLVWLYCLLTNQNRVYEFGIMLSVWALWYLPVGTIFAIIIGLVLIFEKQRIGLSN